MLGPLQPRRSGRTAQLPRGVGGVARHLRVFTEPAGWAVGEEGPLDKSVMRADPTGEEPSPAAAHGTNATTGRTTCVGQRLCQTQDWRTAGAMDEDERRHEETRGNLRVHMSGKILIRLGSTK